MSISQSLAANADFLPYDSALLDSPSVSGLLVLPGKRHTRGQASTGRP